MNPKYNSEHVRKGKMPKRKIKRPRTRGKQQV
jgi:hypothetical protein